jgi:hypothetical protein
MVRCARCRDQWVPHRIEEDAEPAAAGQVAFDSRIEPLPAVTAMDRLTASPAIPPSSPGLLAAWILTLVVLVGIVAATLTWRDAIIRAWPQSAFVLAPFGQPTPAQTPGKTTG